MRSFLMIPILVLGALAPQGFAYASAPGLRLPAMVATPAEIMAEFTKTLEAASAFYSETFPNDRQITAAHASQIALTEFVQALESLKKNEASTLELQGELLRSAGVSIAGSACQAGGRFEKPLTYFVDEGMRRDCFLGWWLSKAFERALTNSAFRATAPASETLRPILQHWLKDEGRSGYEQVLPPFKMPQGISLAELARSIYPYQEIAETAVCGGVELLRKIHLASVKALIEADGFRQICYVGRKPLWDDEDRRYDYDDKFLILRNDGTVYGLFNSDENI